MSRLIATWHGWRSFYAAQDRARAAGLPPPRPEDLQHIRPAPLTPIQQAD